MIPNNNHSVDKGMVQHAAPTSFSRASHFASILRPSGSGRGLRDIVPGCGRASFFSSRNICDVYFIVGFCGFITPRPKSLRRLGRKKREKVRM